MTPNRALRAHADFLRTLAFEGDPTKREERKALSLLLESAARTEALLADFVARANVALSQASGRR